MQVFETVNNTQVLVASNRTMESTISVRGLLPESNYIIAVKAVNDKGESTPVYVGGKTEGLVQSLPMAVEESRLPLLFVIVGILLSLMILGALITATIALRRRQQNKMRAREEFNGGDTIAGGAVINNGVKSAGASTSEEIMLPVTNSATSEEENGETGAPLLGAGGSLGRDRRVSFRDRKSVV